MAAPPNRPATPEDRKWAEVAENLRLQELPQVQASAEKWATTIGALTGLLGLAAVVRGPATVGSLTLAAQAAVVALFVLGLLSAAYAVWQAALAAQGSPHLAVSEPHVIRRLYHQLALEAAARLRCSRLAALAALTFVSAAVIVNWLAPAPQVAIVVHRSGTVTCGALAVLPDGRLAQGRVPVADAISIATAASCP